MEEFLELEPGHATRLLAAPDMLDRDELLLTNPGDASISKMPEQDELLLTENYEAQEAEAGTAGRRFGNGAESRRVSPRNWSSRNRPRPKLQSLARIWSSMISPTSVRIRAWSACSIRPPCLVRGRLAPVSTGTFKGSPRKFKARRPRRRFRTRSRSFVARSLIGYDSQRSEQQFSCASLPIRRRIMRR